MSRISVARRLPTVPVIGTCDTKIDALLYIKDIILSSGRCDAILIDIGSFDPKDTSGIDIPNRDLVTATSSTDSRNAAAEMMTVGLTSTLTRLYKAGDIAGVIGAGGSGNTSVCTQAFREGLPLGFPKIMVSTMASGDVSHYVKYSDITMMYSIVDIAGMNSILGIVLGNAARAIAGMAANHRQGLPNTLPQRPAIAISMFGVTTPCVQHAGKRLEKLGYEVVVFHASGAGGMAMERLISERRFVGVLDLTSTELADELVGGVLSAGPERLEAAGRAGIPQVVSVGALDMVNFGPRSTVPAKFTERLLFEHNRSVTLMRTTREECRRLGEMLAEKANLARPELTRVIVPLRGVSLLDVKGGPFYDPEADRALIQTLRDKVNCPLLELDVNMNDPEFAEAAVDTLDGLLRPAQNIRHKFCNSLFSEGGCCSEAKFRR